MTVHSFGGRWTKEKLEILSLYLNAYTTALKNQPFSLVYVDAFAGTGSSGSSYSRNDYGEFDELLKGSPSLALEIVDKPFEKFIFIEKNPEHVELLESLAQDNLDRDIKIINSDANTALPAICRELAQLERAVVFLDPYATEVSWTTIETIANTRKIDCWILFPLMAIIRLLPVDREPDDLLATKLDRVFGGRQHWQKFYATAPQQTFWSQGNAHERERGSRKFADNYRRRLESVFAGVAPTRRVLKNSQNSDLFDLFFAASNRRGAKVAIPIADHILKYW